MIAKGEKASINFLAWTLHETLNLLRPAQEQCEAPPEPALPSLGVEQSGEPQREFFLLQNEPSPCISLGDECHNIKDSNREHRDWGGTAAQTEGPAVPAAQGPWEQQHSHRASSACSALQPQPLCSLACQACFPKTYLDSLGHNNTELSVL